MTSSKPKILCLVQARMGSSRLPGKMMMKLSGKTLLEWVLQGVSLSQKIDQVVLCTSENVENDILARTASNLGYEVFRGSESNVLERFVKASEKFGADIVVRVCADNPLINGLIIDKAIDHLIATECDYTFNHIPKVDNGYPDGLGAEVFRNSVLMKVYEKAEDASSKEHVTSYIWNNKSSFKIESCIAPAEIRFPEVKLDIDTMEDFQKISALIEHMKKNGLEVNQAVSVCKAYLDLNA
jgi:spore coat polysaccharide biosynthesis protein SpsF